MCSGKPVLQTPLRISHMPRTGQKSRGENRGEGKCQLAEGGLWLSEELFALLPIPFPRFLPQESWTPNNEE